MCIIFMPDFDATFCTNLFHQVARSAERRHAGKFTVQRACVAGVAGRFLHGEARDVDGAVNEERVDF